MKNQPFSRLFYLLEQIENVLKLDTASIQQVSTDLNLALAILKVNGEFMTVNQSFCELFQLPEDELIGSHCSALNANIEQDMSAKLHEHILDAEEDFCAVVKLRQQQQSLPVIMYSTSLQIGLVSYHLLLVVDYEDYLDAEQLLFHSLTALYQQHRETYEQQQKLHEAEQLMLEEVYEPILKLKELELPTGDLQGHKEKLFVQLKEDLSSTALERLKKVKIFKLLQLGKLEVDAQVLDLFELLQTIEQEHRLILGSKALVLQFKCNGEPVNQWNQCELYADPELIKVMLSVLIANAIEASAEFASVTTEVNVVQKDAAQPSWVNIHIENSGAVPQAVRDNFFERFSTSDKDNKAGVGTYLAQSIAKAHDGHIELQSLEDSTRLIIKLPYGSPPDLKIEDERLKDELNNE